MNADYLKAVEKMRRHGGHFASALATAWLHADSGNRRSLEREFSDLLETYGYNPLDGYKREWAQDRSGK